MAYSIAALAGNRVGLNVSSSVSLFFNHRGNYAHLRIMPFTLSFRRISAGSSAVFSPRCAVLKLKAGYDFQVLTASSTLPDLERIGDGLLQRHCLSFSPRRLEQRLVELLAHSIYISLNLELIASL